MGVFCIVDHQMNAKIADLELGTPAGHNNQDAEETDSVSIVDDELVKKGVDSTLSSCLKRVFYGQVHAQTKIWKYAQCFILYFFWDV